MDITFDLGSTIDSLLQEEPDCDPDDWRDYGRSEATLIQEIFER